MGFYYDHIVPHLVNLAMRNRLLKAYRERIVGLAEGRVLEIGIGSGMNLPFYTERATEILGLEPHPKLLEMASQKSRRDQATLIEGSAESIPLDRFSPAAPVKNLTVMREASDGGVKQTTTGERADGTPINGSYTAKYDGKEYSVTGAPYDVISMKQVNANTYTVTQKKTGGKYNQTGRNVVSKDGKTLTATRKGTDADGKMYSATMVFEKL